MKLPRKELENADTNWEEAKRELREYQTSATRSKSQEVLEKLEKDELEGKAERETAKAYFEKCTHEM